MMVNSFARIITAGVVVILLGAFTSAEAHSGRTDSNGGHNCNVGACAGTYHYHNGGAPPPPAPTLPPIAPRPVVPKLAPVVTPPPPAPVVAPQPVRLKSAASLRQILLEKGQKKGVLWVDLLLASKGAASTAVQFKIVDAKAVAEVRAGKTTNPDTVVGGQLYHEVMTVVDGDTIKISVGGRKETIRLLAIDTPETKDPRKPVQCFGREATGQLKTLIGGNKVRLEKDGTQSDRDKYGRLLRYAYLPDGTNLNARMVQSGYAFAYTRFASSQLDAMRNFERQARESNIGLWGAC